MRKRSELTAAEVIGLHESLDRKLERVGLRTQPEVAMRVLELVQNPQAQVRDYAAVVRTDPTLSARLLRLANSAAFAQRTACTSLDRACIILGVERLRALAMGFFMSRDAAATPDEAIARQLWGQLIFRGCLAAKLAQHIAPGLTSEAFVVGLMLDAGVPLMARIVGFKYLELLGQGYAPGKQFRQEFTEFEFTHVDVVVTLLRRWRLPETLLRPIEWHHTPPGESKRNDTMVQLHRIAYYVGAVDVDAIQAAPTATPPLSLMAERTMGLTADRLGSAIRDAIGEYRLIGELFNDVAEAMPTPDELADCVHDQLTRLVEEVLMRPQAAAADNNQHGTFRLGGFVVELERQPNSGIVAYIADSSGARIVSHEMALDEAGVPAIRTGLQLDPDPADDVEAINTFLGKAA